MQILKFFLQKWHFLLKLCGKIGSQPCSSSSAAKLEYSAFKRKIKINWYKDSFSTYGAVLPLWERCCRRHSTSVVLVIIRHISHRCLCFLWRRPGRRIWRRRRQLMVVLQVLLSGRKLNLSRCRSSFRPGLNNQRRVNISYEIIFNKRWQYLNTMAFSAVLGLLQRSSIFVRSSKSVRSTLHKWWNIRMRWHLWQRSSIFVRSPKTGNVHVPYKNVDNLLTF